MCPLLCLLATNVANPLENQNEQGCPLSPSPRTGNILMGAIGLHISNPINSFHLHHKEVGKPAEIISKQWFSTAFECSLSHWESQNGTLPSVFIQHRCVEH